MTEKESKSLPCMSVRVAITTAFYAGSAHAVGSHTAFQPIHLGGKDAVDALVAAVERNTQQNASDAMLLPCPFCGCDMGHVVTRDDPQAQSNHVECANCHSTGALRTDVVLALNAWNSRAPDGRKSVVRVVRSDVAYREGESEGTCVNVPVQWVGKRVRVTPEEQLTRARRLECWIYNCKCRAMVEKIERERKGKKA